MKQQLIAPSDIEIEEVENILDADKSWDISLNGCFYIDVSGKYSVYYTLWRFKSSTTTHVTTCHYITNLSTDLKKACLKAKKIAGRIPVIIDRVGTYSGLFKASKDELLIKGKYRGERIGDVFAKDPQYILWLSKEYRDDNSVRINTIDYYKNLYWETVADNNRKNSQSEYVGVVGEKITANAVIYNVEEQSSSFNDKKVWLCKFEDDNSNKYISYINTPVEKGDYITFTAKVKIHTEKLGIKFTTVNYLKIIENFKNNQREEFNL